MRFPPTCRHGGGAAPTWLSDGATTWLHDGDTNLSQVAATGAEYLVADALGSIRATTDSAGAATGTAGHDTFGDMQAGADAVGRFGFAGGQQDPTGAIYLTARHFLPEVGRFLSVDPIRPGAPGVAGYNPYSYVGNNPTTWVDPTGRGPAVDYGIILDKDAEAAAAVAAEAIVAARFRQLMFQQLLRRLAGIGGPAAGACALACPALGPGLGTGTRTRTAPAPEPGPASATTTAPAGAGEAATTATDRRGRPQAV